MKQLGKILAGSILTLLLVVIIWYSLRKEVPIYDEDPFPVIRAQWGPFDKAKWDGQNADFSRNGFRTVIGQDLQPETYNEHEALTDTAEAWLKGLDIMPRTWIFRSQMMMDFRDFVSQHGYYKASQVARGEFLS
ncbi:MAG: hypothetical protein AAF927_01650 [Bacteroidota bacterium]